MNASSGTPGAGHFRLSSLLWVLSPSTKYSRGPSATSSQVPNVVGQDQQTATNTLQNAGFQVQVIMVPPPDPSQSGLVVDEQPAGGTRAPDGSTVTIYVGSS